MVSVFNLIKCMIIFTLFLWCQIQATPINFDNSNEMEDIDLSDALREFFPSQYESYNHQPYRRASLRYHPHVLYKKASLKPMIGHKGKLTLTK